MAFGWNLKPDFLNSFFKRNVPFCETKWWIQCEGVFVCPDFKSLIPLFLEVFWLHPSFDRGKVSFAFYKGNVGTLLPGLMTPVMTPIAEGGDCYLSAICIRYGANQPVTHILQLLWSLPVRRQTQQACNKLRIIFPVWRQDYPVIKFPRIEIIHGFRPDFDRKQMISPMWASYFLNFLKESTGKYFSMSWKRDEAAEGQNLGTKRKSESEKKTSDICPRYAFFQSEGSWEHEQGCDHHLLVFRTTRKRGKTSPSPRLSACCVCSGVNCWGSQTLWLRDEYTAPDRCLYIQLLLRWVLCTDNEQ